LDLLAKGDLILKDDRFDDLSSDDVFYETQESVVRIRPLPPASLLRRLFARPEVRRLLVVGVLLFLWEIYARWLNDPLLVPTASQTLLALWEGFSTGQLLGRILTSIKVLLMGYGIGIALGSFLTGLALSSGWGREFQATLVAMFNPLPAIALLPLAMLWFGLGTGSLLFVLAHSVMWTFGLNILSGFDGVSKTLRMVGRNYDLRGLRYVWYILIPAAFPSLLNGLRISWAFAWRTLIAAELVFGVSAGSGGLGWYIYENKNLLEIPSVFAGLCAVILIGLIIENLVFRLIEKKTIGKWG
jgi:NitT/TauT family transport system permease protein